MAVTIEPGGPVIIDFDAAIGAVSKDVQTALEAAAKIALQGIRGAWYGGPGYPARQHADGSKSQSTGESYQSWAIRESDFSGSKARVVIENTANRNGVDYAQYVHPSEVGGTEGYGTGGKYGWSMGNAETAFDEAMKTLQESIDQIVRDALADL